MGKSTVILPRNQDKWIHCMERYYFILPSFVCVSEHIWKVSMNILNKHSCSWQGVVLQQIPVHPSELQKCKISAKTLYILSRTWLPLTTLHWKWHWLLFIKLLLVAEYWTTVKSIWPVRQVVGRLTLHIWASIEHIVIFLKIPRVQFYLGVWFP
jgi:hypothetical protein